MRGSRYPANQIETHSFKLLLLLLSVCLPLASSTHVHTRTADRTRKPVQGREWAPSHMDRMIGRVGKRPAESGGVRTDGRVRPTSGLSA